MPSSASRTSTQTILSSRTSREAAGWGCTSWADPSTEYEEGTARPGIKRRQFSWISPKPLWEPRNYKIARWLGDSKPLEDHIRGTRVGDGNWNWEVLLD